MEISPKAIAVELLKGMCPSSSSSRLQLFVDPLNSALAEFDISTKARVEMFLAQVAHESGGFHYVKELASGLDYERRVDLGNVEPGDGIRYKGRGLIQITGRANYLACGQALGLDLIEHPELLEEPDNAARSAAWFWSKHGCNQLADLGDFERITKRINGGLNGYAERQTLYSRAQSVMA